MCRAIGKDQVGHTTKLSDRVSLESTYREDLAYANDLHRISQRNLSTLTGQCMLGEDATYANTPKNLVPNSLHLPNVIAPCLQRQAHFKLRACGSGHRMQPSRMARQEQCYKP